MTKYDVAKEFTAGYVAALRPEQYDDQQSEHWKAGYSAGYSHRPRKNDKMNEYLVSIGHEPMAVVRLA